MNRIVVVACLVFVSASALAQDEVTTRSLLAEMTDLAGLSEFPDPPFTCRQFSSYDRASKSPEEGWFANADRGQYLRVEDREDRREFVMMDAEGPGAIVRIWSANPSGVLRIYLDGDERPVIEAPMQDFLGGKVKGFPVPITGERSRGWNSYFPIPYARHCKVTTDAGDVYYHVNYRSYAQATKVESFRAELVEALAARIGDVAEKLSPDGLAGRQEGEGSGTSEFVWGFRKDTVAVKDAPEGPGAIEEIRLRVEAADLDRALRGLVMTIRFDGQRTVETPVGDFFASMPGLRPFRSLPLEVTPDGEMICRWRMPYFRTASIALANRGEQEIRVRMSVRTAPREWTLRSMHFHAKWRGEREVPTRPMQDWNYLRAEGKGVFVGAAFSIANPVKAWWGEGDEKIYVDGETFPSHFGTGTEDYYGYAWCCNVPFSHAYHGQPRCDGPGNYGHTALHRWHVLDRIPFRQDFRFDMELWHWNETARVDLSVVAYWYALPGGTDEFDEIRPEDLTMRLLPPYEPPRVAGAIEGEGMRIVETIGVAERQEIGGCSGDAHLWWRSGHGPGDRMVLGFEVERAGRYRVWARFVEAADYGIHALSIDDVPVEEPIDFFHDGVIVSEERELGVFELAAGENRLEVRVVGANERAVEKFMFGLDYVRLEPVPD
jgi:hypothetical protein